MRRLSVSGSRRAALLGGCALLAAGLAGCGGGNGGKSASNGTEAQSTSSAQASGRPSAPRRAHLAKVPYERTLRRLGNRLGESVDGLYPLSSGPKGSDTARQTISKLEKTRGVVSGVLAQLEQIAPPAPVAPQHRQLEAGVRQLDRQLDKLIAFTREGDVSAFVSQSGLSSLQAINDAADAMKKKGYDIIGQKQPQAPK